jgi:hypothetical protein
MAHQNMGLPDDKQESLLQPRSVAPPASVRKCQEAFTQSTNMQAHHQRKPIAMGGTISPAIISQPYAMLDTRNKKVGQKRSSTEKKISPIQKFRNAFCIQEGINPTSCPCFLKEDDKRNMTYSKCALFHAVA